MTMNSTQFPMQSQYLQPYRMDPNGRSVLSQAQALRSRGQHNQAIDCLEDAMRTDLRHNEAFAGMALALKARSQIHLVDDAGAVLTVSLVPAIVRRFNPKVDAYCQLVMGLVHRRHAYRSWKAGSPAPQVLQAAIDCFQQAHNAAESAIEQRLACVATLNGLYAQGLASAIAGCSRDANPALLGSAVQAEATARDKTPAEEAASIAGLTIIADMAIGAGLQPQELFALSDAPAFQVACMKLFGSRPGTWPQELLHAATAAGVPAEQKTRALVLGSHALTRSGQAADDQLMKSYLIHLSECDFSLRRASGDAQTGRTGASPRTSEVSQQLALLARLSGHATPGRRAFR